MIMQRSPWILVKLGPQPISDTQRDGELFFHFYFYFYQGSERERNRMEENKRNQLIRCLVTEKAKQMHKVLMREERRGPVVIE